MNPRRLTAAAAAALLLAIATAAPGEEPPARLTLAEAARLALERFPGVAAARARETAALAGVGEAEAALRPRADLTAAATRYQEPSLVRPFHGFSLDSLPEFDETLFRGGLRLSYTLFDGGGRRARVEAARFQARAAGSAAAAAEQEVVAAVAGAYLRVLSLAGIVAAQDRRLEALGAELGRVKQWLEAGRAAEVEVRRAEAARAAAEAERVAVAAALDAAERDLARLTGLAVEVTRVGRLSAVSLAAPAPDPRAALLDRALAGSPEVAAARDRLAGAEAAQALAQSARSPSLSAAAQELGFGSSQGDFAGEWDAGLSLAFPLYTGGATARRIAAAVATREAAASDLALAGLEVERGLDRALADLTGAAARVESLARAEESFAEVARIEKLRLEAGAGTQTDYLEAEAELLGARASLVEARHRTIAARVELARVVGELDVAWVEAALKEVP